MTDVTVTNNSPASRYEARVADELAGFAEYRLTGETIAFTHTKVEEDFEGRGIGGALARQALDDVAATGGRQVVAECEFIKSWIERHPDYAHLVAPEAG